MKVVLAGAFGKLGRDLLQVLVADGHKVIAADLRVEEGKGYTAREIDVTRPETLAGLCDGADALITTVGLTGSSTTVTHYDIDLAGNLNLLAEAKRAGVKKFCYTSVLKAETAPQIPMLDAKHKFEDALKASGIPWMIFRPTGYFYDIVKVFKPMIEKGEVTLLGKKDVFANVIDTSDLARFIVDHMGESGRVLDVGGTETYAYREIAEMCFAAAGKQAAIKTAPPFLFDVLAFVAGVRKTGKKPIIQFSKWTLSNDMTAENKAGTLSFKQYIVDSFGEGKA